MVGVAMGLCFFYAWLGEGHWEKADATRGFGLSTLVTVTFSLCLLGLGIRSPNTISRREGVAIVGLGWILIAAFGSLPFLLCQPRLSLSNAIFESVSGFTTTGATVIPSLQDISRPVLLWRALSQWLGGLGILVLFVALLSHLGIGNKALFRHESSAQPVGNLRMRIGDIAARVWIIYFSLTAICFVGLYFLGMSPFDAICHAFTSISTAGFSTYDQSIGHFQSPAIEIWIMIFMALGGINFLIYVAIVERKWNTLKVEEEVWFFLGFILLFPLIIFTSIQLNGVSDSQWQDNLRAAYFQGISIMTTTGYSSVDYSVWPHFTWVILLLLMGFGGSTGSTSGGIKISRWIIFFKMLWHQVHTAFRPTKVNNLRMNRSRLPENNIHQALFLICLSWVTLGVGTAVISGLQPDLDYISVFSGSIACLFNVGPALESLGPSQTYVDLKPATKYFMCFLMILGRLEFFAILVLFLPALWKKY